MIVNFKLFESISKPYKVDDYALANIIFKGEYYENVLIQILEIIKYDEVKVKIFNKNFKNYNYLINKKNLKCWSENRKELEILIDTNKYNL